MLPTGGLEEDRAGPVEDWRPWSARPPVSVGVDVGWRPWLYGWLYDERSSTGFQDQERRARDPLDTESGGRRHALVALLKV